MSQEKTQPLSRQKHYHNAYKRGRVFNEKFSRFGSIQSLTDSQKNCYTILYKFIIDVFKNKELTDKITRTFIYPKYIFIRITKFLNCLNVLGDPEMRIILTDIGKIDYRTMRANDKIFNSQISWKECLECLKDQLQIGFPLLYALMYDNMQQSISINN